MILLFHHQSGALSNTETRRPAAPAERAFRPDCFRSSLFIPEEQIQKLARLMFGDVVTNEAKRSPSALYEFVQNLHQSTCLSAVGFPNRRIQEERRAGTLLAAYLTDSAVFQAGRQLVFVETQEEIEIMDRLQTAVRKQLAEQSIAVEVNPSSNLLIGRLGDMRDHPLWRIMPVENSTDAPVSLCIGSDDPLTFATDLCSEYQLVSDTLGRLGYSESAKKAWLGNARKTGLLSRFTLPVDFNTEDLSSIPAPPPIEEPTLI